MPSSLNKLSIKQRSRSRVVKATNCETVQVTPVFIPYENDKKFSEISLFYLKTRKPLSSVRNNRTVMTGSFLKQFFSFEVFNAVLAECIYTCFI